MVNSWSLLYDEMYGPDDEANLKTWKEEQLKKGKPMTDDATGITEYPDDDLKNGEGIYFGPNYGYEYTPMSGPIDGVTTSDIGQPFTQDFLADNDDQISHHMTHANSPYNDGWTQEFHREELKKMKSERKQDGRYKYHESEIINDIEDYVSGTYNGHYTGTKHEYRNVQTIDLMASRDLASDFCQANILKYGSRYGSKDGKNKKDLMKVIHYAMLLLHFDEHYGKPKMTSGNIDHNMP